MNEQMDGVFWGAEGLSLCSRNHSSICLRVMRPHPSWKKTGLISCSRAPAGETRPASLGTVLASAGCGHLQLICTHTVFTLK